MRALRRLFTGSALLVAAAALFFTAATSAGVAAAPVTRLGSGADTVWVLRPRGEVRSIVVFGHGWSTPLPSGFAGWIAHLRARGNIVVYPRYRLGAGDSTGSALAAFRRGVGLAFRKSLRPVRMPIVAVGKSFGGSAIFDYAAEARAWRVPAPVAILSVFPAPPNGPLPVHAPARSSEGRAHGRGSRHDRRNCRSRCLLALARRPSCEPKAVRRRALATRIRRRPRRAPAVGCRGAGRLLAAARRSHRVGAEHDPVGRAGLTDQGQCPRLAAAISASSGCQKARRAAGPVAFGAGWAATNPG